MKLREWREKNARTQQQVADELNRLATEQDRPDLASITQGYVHRWEQGVMPRQENVRLVVKLTAGEVTFADFYGEEPAKRRPRARSVSVAASRKAAQTSRRAREART